MFPGTKFAPPPGKGGEGRAHDDLLDPAGLQWGVKIHLDITAAGGEQKSKSAQHKSTIWQ